MRLALVGLGFGVGLSEFHSWSGPRPIFPFQKRQTTTATHEPGEIVGNRLIQKTLCSNQQRKRSVS